MKRPIRVFYSEISGRFYASQHYRQTSPTDVTITGVKYDVTNDIGAAVTKYGLEFTKRKRKTQETP